MPSGLVVHVGCPERLGILQITVASLQPSYHEMRLREDPPELLGLHVLWIASDGFQYLKKECQC